MAFRLSVWRRTDGTLAAGDQLPAKHLKAWQETSWGRQGRCGVLKKMGRYRCLLAMPDGKYEHDEKDLTPEERSLLNPLDLIDALLDQQVQRANDNDLEEEAYILDIKLDAVRSVRESIQQGPPSPDDPHRKRVYQGWGVVLWLTRESGGPLILAVVDALPIPLSGRTLVNGVANVRDLGHPSDDDRRYIARHSSPCTLAMTALLDYNNQRPFRRVLTLVNMGKQAGHNCYTRAAAVNGYTVESSSSQKTADPYEVKMDIVPQQT
jgi:hypothetical protein